jgi:hypothetical protein
MQICLSFILVDYAYRKYLARCGGPLRAQRRGQRRAATAADSAFSALKRPKNRRIAAPEGELDCLIFI